MKEYVDFSKGNITKQMILFSIPIVLSELFQNFYNSVDALVVGNFIGKTALAAVNVCVSPSYLLVGFFNGMAVGASVITSNAFGSRDQEELDTSIRVIFTFSVALGVVLSAAGILCTPFLLRLTGVEGVIYEQANTYLRIYLAGLMFTVIYNIGSGILRAIGDSRTPLIILVISCCVNIMLDIVFVKLIPLGVAGVGFATVLSQGTSVVLIYQRIKKVSTGLRFVFGELKSSKRIISSMMSIGVPAGLQGSLISISNIFVWRYINRFNPDVIAGIGIAQRLDKFVGMPCKAFAMTITTFIGQNVGAKNYKRSREGIAKCVLLSLAVVSVIGVLVYSFTEQCVALFNSDPAVVEIGVAMMHTIIPLYFTMAIREVFLGVLRGYGNTRTPMILSLIGMVGVRQVFLATTMAIDYRIENIYYCYPIAWGSTAILIMTYYLLTRKRYLLE